VYPPYASKMTWRVGLRLRARGEVGDLHAGEVRVEHGPLRHAVDVARLLDLRHRQQLGEVDLERLLDRTVHLQLEVTGAGVALFAPHRSKVLQEVLAGGEARATVGALVVSGALLLLFTGANVRRAAEGHDERSGGDAAQEYAALHRGLDRLPHHR
jgi:hypothetical protein